MSLIRYAVPLLLSAAVAPACAELNFQEVILDNSYFAYERDVGDVNGDGLNDVIGFREGDSTIEVFLAPNWTRSTLITLTGTYRWPRADDFRVADMDGDDDVDVVVRLGSGPFDDGPGIAVWYDNLGGGTNWTQRLIGNSLEYVKDFAVADFDRDDRPDVAMRMDSKTQVWLQEPGGTWTEVLLNHAPHEGMTAGDVDMDGDPDLVLNGFWYATPNTPAACRAASNWVHRVIDSAWFTQTGDWTANSCRVAVGDINGDGTNNVIFSQSERAGYAVKWYRSATPLVDTSWVGHAVAVIDYCHNLKAYDADLDGDTDLLVGGMIQSQHKGLRLLLNGGGGTNWTTHIIQSEGSYSAVIGDIDNDGDLDIVGIRNWNSAPTYIYRSNAGGPPSLDFWKYIRVYDAHVRTFGLAFLDVDGDNDMEIASGPYVYRNPGPPMTGTWTRTTLPNSVHAFLAVDVDGDALADLIAQKDNAGQNRVDIYWVEASNATATAWSAPRLFGDAPRSDHAEGFQGYKLAQIVPGGRPEIVISSMQGVYYFVIPVNPATGSWPRVFVATNDSDEGIGIGDIDGDGNDDIAFTSGGTKSVKWARNPQNGSANWPVFTIGSFPEADWPDRCEVADLNGDGRPDIVATEENSGGSPDALAYWWEQPAGSPTNGNWTRRLITTRYTLNNLDAADMDGDGDVDLVLAEHRGTKKISAFENDGAGAFTERPIGTGKESHLGGRLADLDGDGDLDVVSIAYDGYQELHLWRNDSPSGAPRVAKPVINPNGGVFDEPLTVTLTTSTGGAEIRYTTDGTDPTNASTLYTTQLMVSSSTTLKARGFKVGYDPSLVAMAVFTGPQVKTPVITPPGGSFSERVTVTMATATTGAVLRFTLDGGIPDETSASYAGPITLTNNATVKVRGFRAGLMSSVVAEAAFVKFLFGPVAHWRFDERFGAVAMDSIGNHTGTVVGAAWNGGYFDNALAFDGVDDRVNVGAWDVGGTALTVTAWVKLDPAYADNDGRIVSKATGIMEQDHYWMLSTTTAGADRRLRFRLKTQGSTSTLIASSGHLTLNTWWHVAAAYDGSYMRVFVNGTEVGSLSKTGEMDVNPTVGIFIGANPPTVYAPFRGLIDDVRIFNVALGASEIQAAMSNAPVPPAPEVRNLGMNGGGFNLHVPAEIGHYYVLQHATNLIMPAWVNLSTSAAATVTLDIPHTSAAPSGVYRLFRD